RVLGMVVGTGPLSSLFEGRSNVRCLGQLPPASVALAMAAADMLVLPSHSEGLPTVLMEAGLADLPIVTTDAPGCIDLADEDRPLMVPFGMDVALAQALATGLTTQRP